MHNVYAAEPITTEHSLAARKIGLEEPQAADCQASYIVEWCVYVFTSMRA